MRYQSTPEPELGWPTTGHLPARNSALRRPLHKLDLIREITAHLAGRLSKQDVRKVLEAYVAVGHRHLQTSGIFTAPGFATLVVIERAAAPERQGVHPFTKEPMVIKARPARKTVRARVLKAAKTAVTPSRTARKF